MITWRDIDKLQPIRTENLPRHREITGADIDSRRIAGGMLFIARQGEHADGHEFIGNALHNGAVAAIVEEAWFTLASPAPDWPLIVVRNSDQSLRDLAGMIRRKFNGPVLGITGSNGKTTTKEMTATVLSSEYSVLSTPGNYNNLWGLPLSILRAQPEHDFWILEHGMNRPGEIAELCHISRPNAGLITTISEVHSANFDSLEEIAAEKLSLFHQLPVDGITFQNLDDPRICEYSPATTHVVTYGSDPDAEIVGTITDVDNYGRIQLSCEEIGDLRLPLPGRFQATNALAAIAVGVFFAVDPKAIHQALTEFSPVPGRTNIFERHDKVIIDDSYNANPTSMRAAIDILATYPTRNRRVAILGDMLELNSTREEKHREIGAYLSQQGVGLVLGVGELSRYIVEEIREHQSVRTLHLDDSEACIEILDDVLQDGDVVLVKGSHGIHLERVVEAI